MECSSLTEQVFVFLTGAVDNTPVMSCQITVFPLKKFSV